MEIRELREYEILPGMKLAWEVFSKDMISTFTKDGIEDFRRYILYPNMVESFRTNQVKLFGAFEGQEIVGILILDSDSMIRLFGVSEYYRNRGIGKSLMNLACLFVERKTDKNQIRVSAIPGMVQLYERLGFHPIANVVVGDKRTYIPMVRDIVRNYYKKKKMSSMKKAMIICGSIVLVLVGAAYIKTVTSPEVLKEAINTMKKNNPELFDNSKSDSSENNDDNSSSGSSNSNNNSDSESDSNSTSSTVPKYKEKGITYKLNRENYSDDGEGKVNMYIDMYVDYPSVSGLDDKKVQEKINGEIKDVAYQTVNEIYLKPSSDFKAKMLTEKEPALSSYVQYEAVYQGKDILSIMFTDKAIKGSMDNISVDTRAININLKTGTVYQVKDIVKLDDKFESAWIKVMRSEAGDDKLLSELTQKELLEALNKGSYKNEMHTMFFVTKKGVEIGVVFNNKTSANSSKNTDDKTNTKSYSKFGWVTAPFSKKEISTYKKGDMWDLINN